MITPYDGFGYAGQDELREAIKRKILEGESRSQLLADQANEQQLTAGLGRAANQVGYAIAGVQPPKGDLFEDLAEDAQRKQLLASNEQATTRDLVMRAFEQQQREKEKAAELAYRTQKDNEALDFRKQQLEQQRQLAEQAAQRQSEQFEKSLGFKQQQMLEKQRAAQSQASSASPTALQKGEYYDPETGSIKVVPGSKLALDREAERQTIKAQEEQALANSEVVLKNIERAKEALGGFRTEGITGYLMSGVPGSNSFTAESAIETVKSIAGFDKLMDMKRASKTGGALGNVSEKELAGLQASLGNLRAGMSDAERINVLNDIEKRYLDILSKMKTNMSGGDADSGSGSSQERLDQIRSRKKQIQEQLARMGG